MTQTVKQITERRLQRACAFSVTVVPAISDQLGPISGQGHHWGSGPAELAAKKRKRVPGTAARTSCAFGVIASRRNELRRGCKLHRADLQHHGPNRRVGRALWLIGTQNQEPSSAAGAMPERQRTKQNDLSRCPRCAAQMAEVVSIAPLDYAQGLIAYECPNCRYVTSVVVPPIDPQHD
jgi:hypothetical protein